MSVDFIFQGAKKLQRIYLDGELIWTRKPPVERSLDHTADIPYSLEENIVPSVIKWLVIPYGARYEVRDQHDLHITSSHAPNGYHDVDLNGEQLAKIAGVVADLILGNLVNDESIMPVSDSTLTSVEVITKLSENVTTMIPEGDSFLTLLRLAMVKAECEDVLPFIEEAYAHLGNGVFDSYEGYIRCILDHFATGYSADSTFELHESNLSVVLTYFLTGLAASIALGFHKPELGWITEGYIRGAAVYIDPAKCVETVKYILACMTRGYAVDITQSILTEYINCELTHFGTGHLGIGLSESYGADVGITYDCYNVATDAHAPTAYMTSNDAVQPTVFGGMTDVTASPAQRSSLENLVASVFGSLDLPYGTWAHSYLADIILQSVYSRTSASPMVAGSISDEDTPTSLEIAVDYNMPKVRCLSLASHVNIDIGQTYTAAIGGFPETEYPVQTDTDLYIPQVYTVEQNGSVLEF